MPRQPLTAIIVGAGHRAELYAEYSLIAPDKFKIVGVADPIPVRRRLMAEKFGLKPEQCYTSAEQLAKLPRLADTIINGTMDDYHVKTSLPLLKKGYDILLEKPFALNRSTALKLARATKKYKNKVLICHVLRYAPFYQSIKNHILKQEIGEIVNIQLTENVSYHHMMTSYVRGKWRSPKQCGASMLLAKSCHDMDIMMWMKSPVAPSEIFSYGDDFQFVKNKKPKDAGTRCLNDCKISDKCIYSAGKNYIDRDRWSCYVWEKLEGTELTEELKLKSLKTDNPYGKCVWDFERDHNVDHQCVSVKFSDGCTGTLSMVGGSASPERNIHIVGTKGEIKGIFETSCYTVKISDPLEPTGYITTEYDVNIRGDMSGMNGGHGGGDMRLVEDFVYYVNNEESSISCTSLSDSLNSHLSVFAADKSRKIRRSIKIKQYLK